MVSIQFTKNHVGAYEAALHNGWLDSFKNLKRTRVHTVESVLQECRKFDNYKDFINSDATIYRKFLRMYNSGKIKDEDLPWKIEKKRKSGHMMIVIKKPRNMIQGGISN